MHYSIRHVTKFAYEAAIAESVMEARVQPRTEGTQRCIQFGLTTMPASHVMVYRDYENNLVHHFDIPGRHARLTVTAHALVECLPAPPLHPLAASAWEHLDARVASGEFWELRNPSPFVQWTESLAAFAREISLNRGADPLGTLTRLMQRIYDSFEYSPESTRVDSPIDDALKARRGVCQDFTHIFIALARWMGIPCRYVSGYLFHPAGVADRSSDGATHAWAEAWLADAGWVGFDATNNLLPAERHIRVAIGRDYSDVPPTRGVFKGVTEVRSELAVRVSVGASPSYRDDPIPFAPMQWDAANPSDESELVRQSQQQQQQ